MNEYDSYYFNQAGSGLAGFRGVRYQRGHGFFGRLLSGAIYPALRFLGKNFLKTGMNVASDVFNSNDFSSSALKKIAKQNLKNSSMNMMDEAVAGIKRKMKGDGRRRKKQKKTQKKRGKIVKKNKKGNKSIKVSAMKKRKMKKLLEKNLLFCE